MPWKPPTQRPLPRTAALPPGHRLNGYLIDSVLSAGGFSIVYLAHDQERRPVAIKEYLPGWLAQRSAGEFIPRISAADRGSFRRGLNSFFAESRALAAIGHPNVVKVLDFFRAHETAYLVMSYERGGTLEQCLGQSLRSLPEAGLRRCFVRLLDGLREVHLRRMLHLDIKPANIYIRTDGAPLLIDFGASRQVLDRGRPLQRAILTPGFAAPEQHLHQALGPWTDIYSVGASMFACLAGRGPQPADQRLLRDRNPGAARVARGRYSAELLEIIDWCLQLDPAYRPSGVPALQKALRTSAGGTGLLLRMQRHFLRMAI